MGRCLINSAVYNAIRDNLGRITALIRLEPIICMLNVGLQLFIHLRTASVICPSACWMSVFSYLSICMLDVGLQLSVHLHAGCRSAAFYPSACMLGVHVSRLLELALG